MLKRLVLLIVLLLLGALTVLAGDGQSQEDRLPPLTDPGPYGVRLMNMTFVDESRDDWEIETFILYPADKSQGTPAMRSSPILRDGPPDLSGAPYPLVIYSHGGGGTAGDFLDTMVYLASQGYVVVAPQHHDTDEAFVAYEYVDRPLDIMVVMNELAALNEGDGDLAGMVDSNNVGLMGWSLGAEAVFQMLGLLSDPVHYETWCAEHPDVKPGECTDERPDVVTAYRAQLGLQNMADGTWAPFGDERIHAVLAIDPCSFPLTSEDSLAAVTTPTMILHGTLDNICEYEGNAVGTYSHLGTEDRYLISLVNGSHSAVHDHQGISQHFATAFFGRYLKGDMTFAPYLSQEQLPDWPFPRLAWGPYEAE